MSALLSGSVQVSDTFSSPRTATGALGVPMAPWASTLAVASTPAPTPLVATSRHVRFLVEGTVLSSSRASAAASADPQPDNAYFTIGLPLSSAACQRTRTWRLPTNTADMLTGDPGLPAGLVTMDAALGSLSPASFTATTTNE